MSDGSDTRSPTERVRARFAEAAEGLSSSWSDYQDICIKALKAEVKALGEEFDWKQDGYADAVAKLPDLEPVLKEWQRQKESDPFDESALAEIARRLRDMAQAMDRDLADVSVSLGKVGRDLLGTGLESLCSELATQTAALADPVASTVAPLDGLKPLTDIEFPPRSVLGRKLDASAKTSNVGDFWDYAKSGCVNLIDAKDKAFSKRVTNALDADLKSKLKTFVKVTTASKRDSYAILSATKDIAPVLSLYESRLRDLGNTPGISLQASGAVVAMRYAVRLLAKSISTEMKWLASVGAFTNQR